MADRGLRPFHELHGEGSQHAPGSRAGVAAGADETSEDLGYGCAHPPLSPLSPRLPCHLSSNDVTGAAGGPS